MQNELQAGQELHWTSQGEVCFGDSGTVIFLGYTQERDGYGLPILTVQTAKAGEQTYSGYWFKEISDVLGSRTPSLREDVLYRSVIPPHLIEAILRLDRSSTYRVEPNRYVIPIHVEAAIREYLAARGIVARES